MHYEGRVDQLLEREIAGRERVESSRDAQHNRQSFGLEVGKTKPDPPPVKPSKFY